MTLAIVNVKGSAIARESDDVFYKHAGSEIAVASTKAYTVETASLFLIAIWFFLVKKHIQEEELKAELQKLNVDQPRN